MDLDDLKDEYFWLGQLLAEADEFTDRDTLVDFGNWIAEGCENQRAWNA